jgi:putative addiction module component (TIGR02574 family)
LFPQVYVRSRFVECDNLRRAMTERSEDWNTGLAENLQDDDFVREFVAAAIEEGVPLKAVLLKLSAANRAELAMSLWESLTDEQRDAATGLSDELDRRWAEHMADPRSAIPWADVRRRLRDDE